MDLFEEQIRYETIQVGWSLDTEWHVHEVDYKILDPGTNLLWELRLDYICYINPIKLVQAPAGRGQEGAD